ncbi:DUF485 domain-containing protein [Saccharococcus caldoxylosilyticus]|jgi:uncharacterized membrane protein (DUF485 family)|uniref:DUF485 domain-containing protein n=2 Tax=Saccharococcus caldoxylosilyticus TaxID=81408 RepID=A0A023DD75_9BACL|nr:DUF485 domain-containing protein [Parageobacillus caldoxylosilyticus]OQP00771.1 hypothetical protein BSK33_13185 [Geobacillus sp. 44B]KYD13345.1 hypothetical protein B4119_0969 [Parageobacillus caldoxylosilyticus]MBB3851841.1 uncharacterized membrane protein (DUF485 family) [Parageobacillus caldoxylosilyticus]QNU38029.1 DUF485 domain-containing protein [Geobacillus sp. 44B]QXJ37667.1 hypothetical protein BV455_00929 [Parageobacillus caldoxylosilyticus]
MAIREHSLMEHTSIDYTKITQSSSFQQLMRAKKKFILPLTLFFLIFYFALPILTSYSNVLNSPAIGPISWAWLFAFAQFIMTWALCTLYSKRAANFDEMVEQIKQEAKEGGSV